MRTNRTKNEGIDRNRGGYGVTGLFCVLLTVFCLLAFPMRGYAAEKSIADCTVTLSKTSYTYSGSTCAPTVTVKDGSLVLTEGTDYTLYGATAKTVGEHEITIVGKGEYSGQTTATFTIKKAKNTITMDAETVYYSFSEPTNISLSCRAKDGATLSYSTSTSGASVTSSGILQLEDGFLGKVKVKVKAAATDLYKATSKTFTIQVKLLGTSITEITDEGTISGYPADNDHTAKVFWDVDYDYDIQSVDGFQIRYSTSKTFAEKVYKVKILMLNAFGTLVNACTISSHLTKGDKVYFQIRTYKTALDGKKYYSAWSDIVSHKIDSSEANYYKDMTPTNGTIYRVDGIKYKYKNKKVTAVGLAYSLSSSTGTLTIPSTVSIYGKNYPVTAIQANAFSSKNISGSTLQRIVIGKNVKTIGKNAFSGNYFVTKITIKSTKLKSSTIGENAFKNVGKYQSSVKLSAPDSKKSAYKKLLKKAGIKVTIK